MRSCTPAQRPAAPLPAPPLDRWVLSRVELSQVTRLRVPQPLLGCRGGPPLKVDAWILPRGGTAETTLVASNRSLTVSDCFWRSGWQYVLLIASLAWRQETVLGLTAGSRTHWSNGGLLRSACPARAGSMCAPPDPPHLPFPAPSPTHVRYAPPHPTSTPPQYEPKYGSVVISLVDSHVTQGMNEVVREGRERGVQARAAAACTVAARAPARALPGSGAVHLPTRSSPPSPPSLSCQGLTADLLNLYNTNFTSSVPAKAAQQKEKPLVAATTLVAVVLQNFQTVAEAVSGLIKVMSALQQECREACRHAMHAMHAMPAMRRIPWGLSS